MVVPHTFFESHAQLRYIFLVLCCIIPTCFAYRRRRMAEERIQRQQETMRTFQQQNLYFLNALQRRDSEQVVEARTRALKEELDKTTMVRTMR